MRVEVFKDKVTSDYKLISIGSNQKNRYLSICTRARTCTHTCVGIDIGICIEKLVTLELFIVLLS